MSGSRDEYAADPPATPGAPRDLTRGSAKAGTCPTVPFFAPAARQDPTQ